ncbi:MAG: glycosyltransferase [Nitrospinae bacterium]|nr:glycosyltransferase [Nitrospinota bacterium]
MKLVYTHEVFTQQTYGGVSRYFVELIKNIRKLNVDVSIRIFGGFYINEYLREIPAVFGIKVPPIKYTGLLRRKINQLAQNFWIMQNKPSIIHQSYYSDSIFDKRIKVVLTVPDMIHELHPDSFSDNGETSVLKKRCCERADKIIAISKTTRNDLVNLFGIDPKKIEVIYLASSLEGVTPEQEGKVLFQNYILYVGDRHGYKNFDVLIRAYAKSKQVQNDFNLVCFGGGEFSSSEENKINVLDLKKMCIKSAVMIVC